MTISAESWSAYTAKLARINKKAADEAKRILASFGGELTDDAITAITAAVTKYGEAAAALACQIYDEIAEAQGVLLLQLSEPAAVRQPAHIAQVLKHYSERAPTTIPDQMAAIVKQAAADTTLKNARRDKAEFAWIPRGDACPFCLSIAARGWQEAKKGVSAEHIHAHCNCQYAVRFDKKSGVAGYDPQKYAEMYYGADGSTPDEKVNAMRRENYAKNKEEINRQKREAYAKTHPPKKNATFKTFDNGSDVNDFFYYDGDERGLLARKNSSHGRWMKSLTDDQRSAIMSYTANGYGDLNSWMRGYGNMDDYNAPLLTDMKKDIEKAINDYNLKDNIKVYRAIQPDAFEDYFDDISKLVGTTYTDEAFMSASPVKASTAVNKDCIMEMFIPAGKGRGAYINQLAGVFQDKEYEFLLQHGSKFKITSAVETEDKLLIKMEMIV